MDFFNEAFKELEKTEEWKKNIKAIAWFNRHLDKMPDKEIEEHLNKFEENIDKPLNKKWRQILEDYKNRDIRRRTSTYAL